jgi:hypothetical protein
VTVRAMAVGDGSAGLVTAQPVGVNTRARGVNRSVAERDRVRESQTPLYRRVAQVVWLDGRDSWIAEERSPSAKTVWRTDYTAHMDTVWKPYGVWAFCYRPVAVAVSLLLDCVKFLLIHPARGPLTMSAAFLIVLYATH